MRVLPSYDHLPITLSIFQRSHVSFPIALGCADAASYTGKQPAKIPPGKTGEPIDIPASWVGRIWAQNGKCGAKGESCSMIEFNLDSGNVYTPQSYDISNIQGFTQALQVSASGCATATCKDQNCGVSASWLRDGIIIVDITFLSARMHILSA
jgi:hypothetical protein